MFNFETKPLEFYLPEFVFVGLASSLFTLISLRTKTRKIKKLKVSFQEQPKIYKFRETPVIYIRLKDAIIDTYSANPKRKPGNIEFMDPIGGAKTAYFELKKYFKIYFVYETPEEVWWAREHFGNEILPILKTNTKQDSLFISTRPQIEKSGKFIRFGSKEFPNWIKLTNSLLKEIKK